MVARVRCSFVFDVARVSLKHMLKGGVMTPNLEGNSPGKVQGANIVATETIPMFSGRPKREKVIGREDIMDLDILLHTCDSVEDLLAKS